MTDGTWPQPAPTTNRDRIYLISADGRTKVFRFPTHECHLACRISIYSREDGWGFAADAEGVCEGEEYNYCPDCGRWLGVDADGNPVVGPRGWTPEEDASGEQTPDYTWEPQPGVVFLGYNARDKQRVYECVVSLTSTHLYVRGVEAATVAIDLGMTEPKAQRHLEDLCESGILWMGESRYSEPLFSLPEEETP